MRRRSISHTRSTLVASLFLLALSTTAHAQVLLVGNKSGASVSALDLSSGKELLKIPVGTGPHEVITSPDGQRIVVGNYGAQTAGNTLSVIDWPTQRVAHTIDLGKHTRPHGIRIFSDNTRAVVTTEGSNSLLVVDLVKGKILQQVDVGEGKAHMVALSPDEQRAYVTHVDAGLLSVVALEDGSKIAEIPTGAGAEGIAVTPDGREAWVSNRLDNTVTVVDTDALKVVERMPTGDFPIRIVMDPQGKHALVTCAKSAELAVFSVADKREIKRIALSEPNRKYAQTMLGVAALPIGAIVSADGRHAYAAVSGGNEIAVIDTQNWSVQARWPAGPEPDALAIAPSP